MRMQNVVCPPESIGRQDREYHWELRQLVGERGLFSIQHCFIIALAICYLGTVTEHLMNKNETETTESNFSLPKRRS